MIRPVKIVAAAFFHSLIARTLASHFNVVVISFIVVLLSVRTLADVDLPFGSWPGWSLAFGVPSFGRCVQAVAGR
jgi:hypothetical protein